MAGSSCSANCLRKAVSLFSWAGSLLCWLMQAFHAGKWLPAAFMHCWLGVESGTVTGKNGLEGPQKVKHRTTL